MQPTYFERFIQFVKTCFQEKFSTAFKGCCLGLIGSLNIFWNGEVASSLVIYILKGIGTIVLTGGTTLMTCFVSYKFDKWKNNERRKTKKKVKGEEKPPKPTPNPQKPINPDGPHAEDEG